MSPHSTIGPVVSSIVPLLAFLAIAQPAGADAYEGFDYPTGPDVNMNGGSGFAPNGPFLGWLADGTIVAGSLSNPGGTLATSGNHVEGRGVSLNRRLEQVMGTPDTDVWLSWLQRSGSPESGWHGLMIANPTLPHGSFTGVYFIGEPGSGPGNGTYVIGKAADDANVISSGVPVVADRTAFLVAHLQFRDGNDVATLYVNPAPGTPAPAGGVTYTGLDMPVVNPILAFGGFPFDANLAFDELRVGTNYASVAPLVPEPASVALAATAVALLRRRRP